MLKRLSTLDLRLKVVSASLQPALTLARVLALPVDDLQKLVALGYYREARHRGLTHGQIARRFGKSLRTVAVLAKESKSKDELLSFSDEVERRRRIIEALDQDPRTTTTELREFTRANADDLEMSLHTLEEQGFIKRDGDEIRAAANHVSFVSDDARRRLDSVRHLLEGITKVLYARFFTKDDTAIARVLTFSVDAGDRTELQQSLYEMVRERVIAADRDSTPTADQVSLVFTAASTPDDHHWRK